MEGRKTTNFCKYLVWDKNDTDLGFVKHLLIQFILKVFTISLKSKTIFRLFERTVFWLTRFIFPYEVKKNLLISLAVESLTKRERV